MTKVLRFTASWCAPCKALAPIVESVKEDVLVEVIDIDEETGANLAAKMGIRGVPTLVMVDHEGEEIKRHVGMTSKEKLRDWFRG